MPKLTFRLHDGFEMPVYGHSGDSLLQTALLTGVGGFKGECSGMAICATCHVYIPAISAAGVNPISEVENETLELAVAERTAESRLACQIEVTDGMDGLLIRVPEVQ